MTKTDKERQAKRREILKADKEAYKAYLEKDKVRKARKRLNEKENRTDQQKAVHKLKERNRVKTYRMNKAAATKKKLSRHSKYEHFAISKSAGKLKSIEKASTFNTTISTKEAICSCKDGKRS